MGTPVQIGHEVSVGTRGSRRRRRGFVTEMADEGTLLVAFYPDTGDEVIYDPTPYAASELRSLKAAVPSGWRALDVLNADGSLYLSLRLRPHVIETIEKYARDRGLSFSEGLNLMLREQIERLEALAS